MCRQHPLRSVRSSLTQWSKLFKCQEGLTVHMGVGGRWQWHSTYLLFSSEKKLNQGELSLNRYTPVLIYTHPVMRNCFFQFRMTDLSQRDVLSAITPVFVREVKKADSDCIRLWALINFLLSFFFPMKDSGLKHQVSALAEKSSAAPIFPQRSRGNHGNWLFAQ